MQCVTNIHNLDWNKINKKLNCSFYFSLTATFFVFSSSDFSGSRTLFFAIGTLFGLTQEVLDTSLDTKYALDYWSISHFFTSSGMYFLMLFLFKNQNYAGISAFIITLIYEGIERYWEYIDLASWFE